MKSTLAVVAMISIAATAAHAQGGPPEGNCAMSPLNSCQAKVDLFDYLAPQVGLLVGGGNPAPGQGGVLNGFGHFSAGIRVEAIQGSLPDFRGYAPDFSATSHKFPTKSSLIPLPIVDGILGVYAGYPLGVTRVGGIDLVGDATWLPEASGGSTGLELPNGGFTFGYGARVGLVEEGLLTPDVGFTWLRHELPTMAIHGNAATTSLRIDDIDMTTTGWRVTASKSLITFTVAAGAGQDRYRSTATINKTSGPSTTFPFTIGQRVARTSWFGDVSMNILMAKVVAEIGGVSGGTIKTYNSFGGKAADALRLYGSLGVRVGL